MLAFLVLGVLMIFGIIGGTAPGPSSWTMGEAPFVGGWMSVISVFMIAGFSFQGAEFVGVTAGGVGGPAQGHAAGVMNAVILTAILSAGNSGLYRTTRSEEPPNRDEGPLACPPTGEDGLS